MNKGFLGTAASGCADVILLLELGMGLALVVGAVLARQHRFRAHAICQSAVLMLNLIAIVLFMVRFFHDQVTPKIPSRLGKTQYALATAHAALGGAVELAGLYIVLAVGTRMLPERLRIRRYKAWMRLRAGRLVGGFTAWRRDLRPLVPSAAISTLRGS